MKNLRRNVLSPVIALAFTSAAGQAGVVSYNWDFYGTVPTDPTSFAGVVSAANWNNSYPATPNPPTAGSPSLNQIDDTGTATAMDIHFSGTGQWHLNPNGVGAHQDLDGTHNKRLLKGYVDMVGGNAVTVTLAEIPYPKYDIYIYLSADTAAREGSVTDGTSTFYFQTYGSDAISGDNAVFTQATETDDLTPNAAATYAKFTNLTGTSQSLSVFAEGNGGIAGIQVVEVELPPTPQNHGTWTGGAGDWSDGANWLNATVAQGADRTATFNGASPATATMNDIFSIGSLQFTGADHTIAAGTGSLLLQGLLATPQISVQAGRIATISSTLLGSNGLQKTNSGTLVLSGSNAVSGTTEVIEGELIYQNGYSSESLVIATGAVLELNAAIGTLNGAATTFSGGGTLRKTGSETLIWPASVATFALDSGALIDVREGTLVAGSDANEVWSGNSSDLNVEAGAIFKTVEANARVNKITGSGSIGTGYNGGGYQSLTVGVTDGSSTFSGSIGNTEDNPDFDGNLVKEGSGTITLAGINTYTGNTTINSGTLELADDGQLTFVVWDFSSNSVGGLGIATIKGDFSIDTTAVTGTTGWTWTLVNLAGLDTASSFASTFSVIGFDDTNNDGVWTMSDAKGDWSFSEATGELTLVIGVDYDTWKSANGVTGGENDDDDNDGLSNHEEYAFGLDPTAGSPINPIIVPLNKAAGTFSYTRRLQTLTGLAYSIWTSANLVTWTEDTGATEGTPTANGDVETVPVTLSSPPTASALFIRVQAQ
jgi:autotransporter-associated beta strand protein